MSAQPNLFDFVPRAPNDATFHQLVAIAVELEKLHTKKFGPLYGIIIGEVVFEAEQNRGLRIGGVPMENKILEQRQTSWLPRVMKSAGFVRTAEYRPSPVKRHHSSPHRVYVRRQVKP
jgi:hypothetical protein